ncbi:MAG: family 43 glycosylhydrolase [Chloroflexi bacterium]|nr:family 43 glycosylhydrolase [Chloroflexota bacterium]
MPLSAAMRRFNRPDKNNPWFAKFKYSKIQGLGYEKNVVRRDCSSIIPVDGKYYVWYTRARQPCPPVGFERMTAVLPATPWDLADVWYATSLDGYRWEEQGPAVERGPAGAYDERGVFTPGVLAHDGRYYLVYQVARSPNFRATPESIAIAWADSPDGPWNKSPAPIVEPDESGEIDENGVPEDAPVQGAWDSLQVHDPALLFREGQFWLYYKGEGIGYHHMESKWGVAIADSPLGPYTKSPFNPVTNSGHEVVVWQYAGGVAGLVNRCGPEKNTIQFAPDGINFEVMSQVVVPPQGAGPLHVADAENTEPLSGFSWGLSHVIAASSHLIKQGQDPLGLAAIEEPWDFLIRWELDHDRRTYI